MTDPRESEADEAMRRRDFKLAEARLSALTAAGTRSIETWMKLAAARRALADPRGALQAVAGALSIDPIAFMPLFMQGILQEALGDEAAAQQAYGKALFHCPPELERDPVFGPQISRVREANRRYLEAFDERIASAASAAAPSLDPEASRRLTRFRDNILRKTRVFHQEASHFHYPGLPEVEFLERRNFPFLEALEAMTDTIRSEFDAVVAAEAAELVPYITYPDSVPLAQWAELNRSSRWTAIHLIRNGEVVTANARHCPETMRLFADLPQPDLPGFGPNLMFSMLAAGTRIPPHSGVANTRVVLHLPLIVPPGCGFRVGAETREWTIGEAFVFDDTIEHEAWNDSDRLRVVLIGDLWHPAFSEHERSAIGATMMAAAEIVQ